MTYSEAQMQSVSGAKRWLCWLLAPLPLLLPYMLVSHIVILGNADALFYSNILAMTSEAVKSGEFFQRWLGQANAGFGSPAMMFYASLSYILTAIVTLPLMALHIDSGSLLMAGMYASQVVSGWTAFLWLKRSFSPKVAFTGSLLFVLLPYKLIYIYLHFNLAQLWALAFLPVWMIAAEKMIEKDIRAVGLYALALAAVYYTHPLTLIAFGAVPVAYVLWFGRRSPAGNTMCLLVAHLLGFGMCLAHALPGHVYEGWIHAERFFTAKYLWKNNFFHIDVVFCAYYGLIAILVGIAAFSLPSFKKNAVVRAGVFWIFTLFIVAFLTQKPSTFVWELLPPLQYLQFPAARLHAVALMAVIYLICIWLAHYKEMLPLGPALYQRATLAVLIVAFGLVTAFKLSQVKFDPANFNPEYRGAAQDALLVFTPVPLYETQWGCIEAKKAYALYTRHQVPEPVVIAKGQGTVSDIRFQPPSQIAFSVHARSQTVGIRVRQCYFPLWQAVDETGHAIALSADADANGVIGLTLPEGTHTITIVFASTPLERTTGWISVLSLLLAMAAACMRPKHGVKAAGPSLRDDFS